MLQKIINYIKEKFWHQTLPKWFLVSMIIISVLGIIDAGYLTYEHYSTPSDICPFSGGIINCARVQNSQYSVLFGVPVALLGLIYYAILAIVLLFTHFHKNRAVVLLLLLAMAVFGCLFSFWLLYVQMALIHYLCSYCIFSLFLSLAAFFLDIYMLRKYHVADF